MPLELVSWNAVVKKKFMQSTEFKNLDVAVATYLLPNGKTQQSLANLAIRWKAWEEKLRQKNKNYKNSDRYSPGCALDDIAQLLSASGLVHFAPILGVHPSIPRNHMELIQQRDALNPNIRSGGNQYERTGGGWKEKIFSQEETYSCTCACATTFLSKLIEQPVDEKAFKAKYSEINGYMHDFSKGGTTWDPICRTLEAFGADVVFHKTGNLDLLKGYLIQGSFDLPVLFGIQWDSGGSPGGGHALMCIGKGPIPGWNKVEGPGGGFLIQDPWHDHQSPGMLDNGVYYVQTKTTNIFNKGNAKPEWGCITGKKFRREYGKFASPKTVGKKVMF
jgi:hypothetical protein